MLCLGRYIPRRSLLHALDPRIKLASLILLSLLLLRGGPLTFALLSGLVAALAYLARLGLWCLLRALRPVRVLFLLLFALHLFFAPGPAADGLRTGALVTWQFALLILLAALLTLTTTSAELIAGLERLLHPLRTVGVPSHDVALLLSLALRCLPLYVDELHRLREARLSRGASPACGTIRQRIRWTVGLLIPLLLSTVRRAEELASAMEARGYRRGPRTYGRELRMRRADWGALLVLVLVSACHLLLEPFSAA
jgi:energy-coupling factor transporter transmembrane protein EcfT